MSTEQNELDDLKKLWQGLHNQPSHQLDETSIRQMLQQRMQGPLGRIQRTVRIEMWITYGVTALMLIFPFINPAKYLNWPYALVTLVMLILCYVYYRSHARLAHFNYAQTNAKQAMQVLINQIEGLLRKYYIICQLTLVPSILIGMLAGYSQGKDNWWQSLLQLPQRPAILAILLGTLLVMAVGGYYFLRWYFHVLYGRYVAQLRRNLNELDETY